VKLNINSVEVHPQLSYNGHPVDGVLVGAAGSLWLNMVTISIMVAFHCTKHMLLLHQASKALWLHYLPTFQALLSTFEIYLIRTIGQKKTTPFPPPNNLHCIPLVVLPKCTDAKVPAQKKQK